MSIEAMKQALETLVKARSRIVEAGGSGWKLEAQRCTNAITALRTAIAEAEKQEPVAHSVVGDGQWGEWLIGDQFETSKPPKHKYWENRGYELVPLYTTQSAAQRQWIGLTEAEINEWDYDTRDLVMDIEKLLREKNHG